jgi:hypothetical protein
MKHFFDRTFLFFVLFLLFVGIIIYASIPNRKPADVKVAAIQKTQLFGYGDIEPFGTINKGDSLVILGQDVRGLRFLVQTAKGERGYIDQEGVDARFIVYSLPQGDNLSIQKGDTVTFVSRGVKTKKEDNSDIITYLAPNGTKGEINEEKIISTIGNNLLEKEIQGGDYYLSKKKFEKLYIGKTFDEIEQLYRPAMYVKKDNDFLQAKYPLRVFDKADGKFYNPIINFKDGVAISYSTKLDKDKNSFFLKYMPLVSAVLDVDFFSQLISWEFFEEKDLDSKAPDKTYIKVLVTIGVILVMICAFLLIFALNIVLPCLLFGLLRFRYPLIFISNNLFPKIITIVYWLGTYVLIILGLSYPFDWWYYVPIVIVSTLWVPRKMNNWFAKFPSNRCPNCKSLYTIVFEDEAFEREYQEWRIKENANLLSTKTSKEWVHDTEVTKWSDGSTSSRNVNHRRVTHTTRKYRMDVYDVLYLVKVFKRTYKCEHCGYEEYGTRCDEKILDKKYKGSYADSDTTSSGY